MTSSLPTFYYIPHTHWEGAVFKTREQYLEIGLPVILKALKLLQECPDYRFVLDQACFVEPFIDRYPEQVPVLRQLVAEGRLALVGGTDVMLDVNMPGGESFVRQVLYGKGFFRRRLGVDITTGWQLDTFGHHAQMPQLLRLAGFTSFWFFRGVADWNVPAEFDWQGLDGTRIPAFWLAQTYTLLYGVPNELPAFSDFMRQRYDLLTPQARGNERVGAAGGDVTEPEEHAVPLVDAFNRQPDAPFHLQFALPADYEAAVARRPEHPVVGGELNPIFQGTYSSRIELKQQTRELEGLLTTAEKLGVILQSQGVTAGAAELWKAWEPMLFNQAHDLMSGVMTDGVYEDTFRGYDLSRKLAQHAVRERLAALVARIDTRGEGIPLVVFNPAGAPRTDVVMVNIGFSTPGMHSVRVIAPDGTDTPVQLSEAQHCPDGSLVHAQIAFVARALPALGYALYRVLPQIAPAAAVSTAADAVLENEFYRVTVDPATGAIAGVRVKDGDWELLRAPGNVVAMEEDRGDFWELYKPLDGGSRIAMKERHPAPLPGKAVFSTDQRAEQPGSITCGPVFSEFTVAHPFGEKGRFQTRIRLYAGLRRIEIRTTLLNQDTSVRYRVLFPTTIATGANVHEIPFGAMARPEGIEFPAQNWVDWGDDRHGVALLNRGLPGNNTADGTLLLSLLRSTQIVAYSIYGGYEGQSSATGLELGKELVFDYALTPHAGDWRQAAPWADGQAFNQPLLVVTAAPHAGPLPGRWECLTVSHPNVVVSALKPGENGGAVLRVYETAGVAAAAVSIGLPVTVSAAQEVNLMEDALQPLSIERRTLRLSLRPFEIKTIALRFGESEEA